MKRKRDFKIYLREIIQSIKKIENYTQNVSYEDFTKNDMMVDAIVRNLIIVGEAANHIPNEIQQQSPEIRWRGVVGLRNLAVHEYFNLQLSIIWKIISEDLPVTKKQLLSMVAQLEDLPE